MCKLGSYTVCFTPSVMALLILAGWGNAFILAYVKVKNIDRNIKPLSLLVNISLLGCFLLYAVMLVQLNLGMPIIQ
ncbi:MAG: hypothetical protein ACI8VC_002740 [Candidatus Endobugula sp.]|jgi:hypothetical protein